MDIEICYCCGEKMPNVNPRTNLTLKPELHDLIQETADHLGLKRAQLITNLLEEFALNLKKCVLRFEKSKKTGRPFYRCFCIWC